MKFNNVSRNACVQRVRIKEKAQIVFFCSLDCWRHLLFVNLQNNKPAIGNLLRRYKYSRIGQLSRVRCLLPGEIRESTEAQHIKNRVLHLQETIPVGNSAGYNGCTDNGSDGGQAVRRRADTKHLTNTAPRQDKKRSRPPDRIQLPDPISPVSRLQRRMEVAGVVRGVVSSHKSRDDGSAIPRVRSNKLGRRKLGDWHQDIKRVKVEGTEASDATQLSEK